MPKANFPIKRTKLHHITTNSLWTVLFIAAQLILSCKTDFNLNEPYKEKQIIYGLVGYDDSIYVVQLPSYNVESHLRNDTVLYFKIGKAFQNTGGSAYQYAKSQDSLYYGDELQATLTEQFNQYSKKYKLQRITNVPKQSGVFSYPGQVLYRTPVGFKLHTGDTLYTINTENTKTGLKCNAITNVIGQTNLDVRIALSTGINIPTSGSYPIYIRNTGRNAKFYTINLNVYLNEVNNGRPFDSIQKKITWNIAQYLTTNTTGGGEQLSTNFISLDFYNFMAQNLTADASIKRKIKYIEFELLAGGEEIYNYINVNTPSLGIVQKIPEYTNVNNGIGIFSARNRMVYTRKVDPEVTKNLKSLEVTRLLNFVN